MSRIHSPRVSNITRSATNALLLVAAACASKVSPPLATIATPAAAHVGVAVQLDGTSSVSLRPGQALSYNWSFLALPPRSQSKLNDAHLASPSFIPDTGGTYALRMVIDDGLLAASADVSVAVADDCRPAISAIQQLPERPNVGQTAAMGVTATPSCGTDASIASLQWTIVAAPAGSKAQILLATTGHPSFAPDVRGDYDLLVTATDSRGLQSSDTAAAHLRYSTLPCGDNSPVVNSIASAPLFPDVGTQVQLTPTVHDDDKDSCVGLTRSYSYAWRLLKLPAGSRAQLNNPAVEKPSFTPDVNGTYTASLIVTDNLGRASGAVTVEVITTHCGDSTPVALGVAALGPPLSSSASVATTSVVQLHTQVQDADNPAYNGLDSLGGPATTPATGCGLALSYTYQWQLLSAPAGSRAALNDRTLANPSFTADVAGLYAAQVIALASTGHASAPAQVTVTAVACGSIAMTASIVAPALAITSAPVQLLATVGDTNSSCGLTTQPYSFAWRIVSAPAGSAAALNAVSSATPSFTPDKGGAGPLGDYLLALTVTDQIGLSVLAAQQTVHANDCNQALTLPTIVANGTSIAPLKGITGAATLLSASSSDFNTPPATPAAGDCRVKVTPLSYQWTLVKQPQGSTAALNATSSATPSFTADIGGTTTPQTYTVQVVITDAAGNRSPAAQADVLVTSCNQPLAAPSIGTVAAAPFNTGAPIALKVTNLAALDANDPAIAGSVCKAGISPFTFSWTMTGQPSSSHAVLNNANAVNPSFVPDVGGDYKVRLIVTDLAGNASPATEYTVAGVGTCNQPLSVQLPTSALSARAGLPFTLPTVLSASAVANAVAVSDPNDPVSGGCTAVTTPVAYAWQMIGLPSGSRAALNNPAAASPTFTPDVASTTPYSFVLTVTDAQGNRGVSQKIDVPALAANACNQPLVLPAPAYTVTPSSPKVGVYNGSQISVASAITDPNPPACVPGSLSLSWSWTMLARPPGSAAAIVDPTAAVAKFTADLAGTYVLSGRATDALGNSASVQVPVVVSGCATAPNVSVSATPTGPEVGQKVSLAATVTGTNSCGAPSVAPFSYAWQLAPPIASTRAVLASQSGASTSFVPDVTGTYGTSVLVTDAVGAQQTANGPAVSAMDCTFNASKVAITPTGGSTGTTFTTKQLAGSLGTLAVGCTAPPPVSYQWSFDALPPRSTAQFNAPLAASTSFVLDVPNPAAGATPWVVRLTITDLLSGLSASNTASFFTTDSCGSNAITAKIGTAGATTVTPVNHPSYPTVADNSGLNTANAQVQLDGLSGLPSTPPNSGCGASGYTFRWTLLQLPPGSVAAINPVTAALPTVTLDKTGAGAGGDYVFSLVVSDGIVTSAPTYLRLHNGP